MRNKVLMIALISAALLSNISSNACVYAATLTPRPAAVAPQAVTVDAFYQSLGSYGHWFSHDRFGWAWMPYMDDLAKQQQQDRRMLEQQQNAAREALRQQHQHELAHPPSGTSPGNLAQRHQNEQR